MGNMVEVRVPDIGDFKEVEVIELLVKPGDTIAPEQSLITVESDKASMEIPSSGAGVVREIKLRLGDKISKGSLILLMDASSAGPVVAVAPAGAAAAPATEAAPASSAAPVGAVAPAAITAAPATEASPGSTAFAVEMGARPDALAAVEAAVAAAVGKTHASPSVRRSARELGVDLT